MYNRKIYHTKENEPETETVLTCIIENEPEPESACTTEKFIVQQEMSQKTIQHVKRKQPCSLIIFML